MREVLIGWLMVAGCTPRPAGVDLGEVTIDEISAGLEEISPAEIEKHAESYRALLADALAKDPYLCLPPVDVALGPPTNDMAERRIHGEIPHYNVYFGPMRYRVRADFAAKVWRVSVHIALSPSSLDGTMEMPDCAIRDRLSGPVVCEGTPYEKDKGVKACPESGRFEAPISRANLQAMTARWSEDVEEYWNRDADRYGLPVVYDFEFFLDRGPAREPVDVHTEMWMTCGRTPYFSAFRTGWSIPIMAHEVGHYLGLLDEYEALSGMLYEKTPFDGSENSRMGLSMKTYTRLYPMHHYLVLRRFHCSEPEARDPYKHVLDPATP